MPAALNLVLIAILIIAAGLGGYVLAQIKSSARLEQRAIAYRGQITRLKRAATNAEAERDRVAGDLDRAQRRLRRYELALYNKSVEMDLVGQTMPAPADLQDQTARYEMPGIEADPALGEFDGEVLEDVQKTIDVDRFRVHFVRREIA